MILGLNVRQDKEIQGRVENRGPEPKTGQSRPERERHLRRTRKLDTFLHSSFMGVLGCRLSPRGIQPGCRIAVMIRMEHPVRTKPQQRVLVIDRVAGTAALETELEKRGECCSDIQSCDKASLRSWQSTFERLDRQDLIHNVLQTSTQGRTMCEPEPPLTHILILSAMIAWCMNLS